MVRYLLPAIGSILLVLGCGDKAEIERINQLNANLETENRSIKISLNKVQPQLERAQELDKRLEFLVAKMKDVKARIITDYGNIEMKFHPEKAPLHCLNFITRAESGFYNGSRFHRVIPGFMIQGGDPLSKDDDPRNDGGGGPLVNIPHEFNDTKHVPGVISMARAGEKSYGAGSQFFIMHGTKAHLDGEYTAFAEVTSGMDTVDKIAFLKIYEDDPTLNERAHPIKPAVIKRIEVYR